MASVFIAILVLSLCSLYMGHTKSHFTERNSLTTTIQQDTPCTQEYSCLNCTAARICAPDPGGHSFHEIKRFSCPSTQPWCNSATGTCSSTQDSSCFVPVSETNFTCMRDGYFPDPYNCSIFYHCQNDVAYEYVCQSNTPYYDPDTQTCESYKWCVNQTTLCYSSDNGRKIYIPYASNLFGYCLNYKIVSIDRCIGAYVFDEYCQMCIQYCPYPGLFPRDDDCANYYRCSPASHRAYSGYIITNLTCPPGQGFLESEYDCVDRSLVLNCNVSSPDLFN